MAKMVAAVHTLARADRRIAATVDQWDADPMLLNTPDGIVDLRDGTVRKSDPRAYCTKITAVGPRGDCPLFLKFLDRIMGGDEALIAYLQRVFGYCLTGDTSEQAMFFNYGVGANGKTVLMSTVSGILGDYCMRRAHRDVHRDQERPAPDRACAPSRRSARHRHRDGGRPALGGKPPQGTDRRREDRGALHEPGLLRVSAAVQASLSGNHKPRLRSVGVAMRRRVNMIPFAVTIPEDERDPHLAEKLKAEWPGILQWMIDGCLDWQEHGLDSARGRHQGDRRLFQGRTACRHWLEECCERDPNAWT